MAPQEVDSLDIVGFCFFASLFVFVKSLEFILNL
jgi:hypothetical protein